MSATDRNSRKNEMADASLPFDEDAWIERLLREDAAHQPHIDDGGFSARVLAALPAPRKSSLPWLMPAATAAGSAVATFLTPAGGYFARGFAQLAELHFSSSALLVLVPIAVLYACSFAAVRE